MRRVIMGTIAIVLLFWLTGLSLSWAARLVSSPSDLSVIGAMLLYAFTAVLWIGLGVWVYRKSKVRLQRLLDRLSALLVVPFLIGLALLSSSCGKVVQPGFEGIKIRNLGANRGVDTTANRTGWVGYGWQEHVEVYPVHWVNYVYTASKDEGSPTDQSISFNSAQGIPITADVGMVVRVKPGATPKLYEEYKQSMDNLVQNLIYNEVRDCLNREGGQRQTIDIMSTGKAALLDSVKADLNNGPLGRYLEWQTVSFVHNPKPDPEVQKSINNVITAANNAQAAVQNALANVNGARGDSAAAVIRATGTAEANNKIRASLTPEVIQWALIHRWDGHRATVEGGGGLGTMLTIPTPTK